MARIRLTTYQDAIDHLVDYVGGATDAQNYRLSRRAIQDAYNKFPSLHNWSYLYTRGRVTTVSSQTSGTIAYTHSTRTVTLTSSTWPSWVTQGVIVIANVPYPITSSPTSTTIVLPIGNNPGANVASGTSYTLYQDAYSLPEDFSSTDEIVNVNDGSLMSFEHPSTWLTLQRIPRGPSLPYTYSIMGSTAYFGAMSLRLFPAPDQIYYLDFIYKRRPRPLVTVMYDTGTVSTTSGSTTATGSGTSWDSTMVGSSIRFSASGNNVPPTGPGGENPFSIERTVLSVESTTSLTLDADPESTASGLSYAISDPLDIEEGAMLSFFLRVCEKQMRRGRRMVPIAGEDEAYVEAMRQAMEADNRSSQRQAVFGGGYYRRLRDYPQGQDQGV